MQRRRIDSKALPIVLGLSSNTCFASRFLRSSSQSANSLFYKSSNQPVTDPPFPPSMTRSISILTLILTIICTAAVVSGESPAPTAYELLQDYNFPPGLLPKGITHYDLNNSTGEFHAYLNDTCSFSLEGSYQLKYRSTIGGRISKNKLTNLSGVSVKVFFVWLNIVEVVRYGDDISLSVGIASATFPADNFEECPQCGCGLDCGGLVSSV